MKIDINVHVFFVDDKGKLDEIIKMLTAQGKSLAIIQDKLKTFMAKTSADFDALMGRLDAASNAQAQRLQALKDQIAGLGLDASTEEGIFNKIDSSVTFLEGLGKDPENPVPEPAPEEPGGGG